MYVIYENTFDIPLEDLRKVLILAESEIFKFIPKWTAINCKNAQNIDFSKPIVEIGNLQNIFTSEEILACLNLNRLKIQIGFFNQSEYISFKGVIRINLGKTIFEKAKDLQVNQTLGFSEFSNVTGFSLRELKLHLSRERFLDSLAHELTHFMDNSLHNNDLYNKLKKAASKEVGLSTVYKSRDINLSHMEMNAQIQAIKNLKAIYTKQWDSFSIFDVIKRDASLLGLYRHFSDTFGKQEAIDWIKRLQKRLYREGLLGKRMTNIPINDAVLTSETFTEVTIELQESCNIEKYIGER